MVLKGTTVAEFTDTTHIKTLHQGGSCIPSTSLFAAWQAADSPPASYRYHAYPCISICGRSMICSDRNFKYGAGNLLFLSEAFLECQLVLKEQ